MDIVNIKGSDNEIIISEKIKYSSLFQINIIGNNNKLTNSRVKALLLTRI
jgi:hypothetical protein